MLCAFSFLGHAYSAQGPTSRWGPADLPDLPDPVRCHDKLDQAIQNGLQAS